LVALPHLVHIVGSLTHGGVQRRLLHLTTSPLFSNYRHSIVCIVGANGALRDQFTDHGIAVYLCRMKAPQQLRFRLHVPLRILYNAAGFTFEYRLRRLLEKLRPDLVHTQIISNLLDQTHAIQQLGIPMLWTDSSTFLARGLPPGELDRVLRMIAPYDDSHITVVSQAVCEEITAFGHIPHKRIHQIVNGVNLAVFAPSAVLRTQGREQLGIPHDAFVFGAAGRMVHVKRFDLVIEAFANVIQSGLSAHLVLIGDGSLRGWLQTLAGSMGLADRIHFVGAQHAMNPYLNILDAFVLSSDAEGMANVLLEALAVDLPCIATNVGGVGEVLGDHAYSVITPAGDATVLAQAMLKVAHQAMPSGNARAVAARFDLNSMLECYHALYGQIIAQKRTAS
jgi:glycosyltransferase involved in cell wall biosynthesis